MSKTNDKEKSIKPVPFKKVIETFAPAFVWPDVPEEVKKEYPWNNVLRDWICEITPEGKIEEYMNISLTQHEGSKHDLGVAEIRVTFFTHTYRYELTATEKEVYLEALDRKPIAGTECAGAEYRGKGVFRGTFSVDSWNEIKKRIIRVEAVKIVKYARDEEKREYWRKLTSHYADSDGKEKFAEWEQKGDEIRNHRIYERVK